MLRRIKRAVRNFHRANEAARRELRWHDRMADEGETWTAAQWGRAVRHTERLYRLSCGMSPWSSCWQDHDRWEGY